MASMTELSFNWKGFISAMTANVAFTYRNIYSKKAMVCGPTSVVCLQFVFYEFSFNLLM